MTREPVQIVSRDREPVATSCCAPCNRLSALARERIEAADARARALAAFGEVAELMDPDHRTTRWALAGAIAGALQRFESGAWKRIARGAREPRNAAERALATICADPDGPRCRERISDLLD